MNTSQQQLNEIRAMRSNSTNLITYYIRGDQANQTSAFLRDELSQANNIKAKETRTGVQDALRAIVRELKDVARIPARGLAIFSGAGQCV
jgi:peptide chain release factor subunit 1